MTVAGDVCMVDDGPVNSSWQFLTTVCGGKAQRSADGGWETPILRFEVVVSDDLDDVTCTWCLDPTKDDEEDLG